MTIILYVALNWNENKERQVRYSSDNISEHKDTVLIRLLRYCNVHLLFYDAAVTPYVGSH